MSEYQITSTIPKYGRGPRDLIRDPSISDRAKTIYAILDDYTNGTPSAYPKRRTLAEYLGCSLDSVDRAVNELAAAGWITKQERFTENGRQTSTLYILHGGRAAPMRPSGAAPMRHHEEEPVEEKNASTPVEAPRRRSTQALVARWVEGHEGAGRHRPPDAQVRKFGHHAAGLVKELTKRNGTLRDCLDSDWQRALDTAYYLGAKAVYPIVASYFGENGTPPDLPPDGRYVLYESGTVAVW